MILGAIDIESIAQHVVDATALGCLYALLALGLALIFGVMGLLNWAQGDLVMVGAYTLVVFGGLFLPLAVPLMILVVVGFALLMERIAFRPVRNSGQEVMLVTSFGVSFFLQSAALLVFGATARSASISTDLLQPVVIGGLEIPRINVVTVLAGGGLLVALTLLLGRSRFGLKLRAAATDFDMARMLGLNANRVIAGAFALSGLVTGVAAFLYTAQTSVVTPTFGLTPVIIAFVAVIVGGIGSLTGGAVGGFSIGALTVVLQVALPEELRPFRDAFLFGIVFAILAVRPQGLIAPRRAVARI